MVFIASPMKKNKYKDQKAVFSNVLILIWHSSFTASASAKTSTCVKGYVKLRQNRGCTYMKNVFQRKVDLSEAPDPQSDLRSASSAWS